MSPEMVKEQNTNLTTDFWALGCIVYKMITGGAAFKGVTPP
jgi:serine/threonine protein kinase